MRCVYDGYIRHQAGINNGRHGDGCFVAVDRVCHILGPWVFEFGQERNYVSLSRYIKAIIFNNTMYTQRII